MTKPAILDRDGSKIPEGLIHAAISVLIAPHDLKNESGNSAKGSVYVVKPKMHGPEEISFANEIFNRIEAFSGLAQYNVKIGLMDNERCVSVNLKECIRPAKSRVAFIETGFWDSTGDEIHRSMEADPFNRKDFIKRKAWITAYENQSVDLGSESGFAGKPQIGKGMWPVPDMMAAMLEQKIEDPKVGANFA